MDGLTIRSLTGEALVSLAKAATAFTITGLDSEAAAFRLGIRHDGLDLAPSILDAAKVPHRALFDLGISDIGVHAVGKMLRAAATMANENGSGEDKNQSKKQDAAEQMLAALAMCSSFAGSSRSSRSSRIMYSVATR